MPRPICPRGRRCGALTADEQAKQFWLPAGYRLEPVLSDPLIDSPGQITFDGNGRMFLVELRGYVQTPDGVDSLTPDRPHLGSRGSRRRRHVRASHRVRRRPAVSAVRDAVRRERDPDQRDQQRRGVEVHRHQRRRRRRQEGSVHDQLRPRRQHGGAAVEPDVGDGQLAVQHGQLLPHALDARRRRSRGDRTELVAVGRDPGQSRQGLVPARRQRPAGLLPVSGALRQLRDPRSVRARPRDCLAGAAPHWRRAGGSCPARACRMAPSSMRLPRRETRSIAVTGCRRICSATTCTARRWRGRCGGCGR